MNSKSIVRNIFVAFTAQGVSLVLSIIQSLIVPKVLGIREFSYWQLYLFYTSYVGFFHLGLSSGVYLEMGGISREKIDKDSVKSQFLFGITFQTIASLAIFLISFHLVGDVNRRFVLAFAGIYVVLQNSATYMMNVLQCMNETRRSSVSTIVERIGFLIPMILFLVSGVSSFKPFVVAYTLSTVAQVSYCLFHLADFIKARWLGWDKAVKYGISSIKIGISLMLANLASMLILGSMRFAIDYKWGIETFGKLSLVLSMVSLFLAFVSQAAMVLFPALRQSAYDEVRDFYALARDALSLLFPFVYILYFPMSSILRFWLPTYSSALSYLALLLPICVFDSKMSLTGSTYFNVLRKERVMLILNICSALCSAALSLYGALVADSIIFVLVSAVMVIIMRSLVSEAYLTRLMALQPTSITLYEIVLTLAFVLLTRSLQPLPALCLYGLLYLGFLAIFKSKVSSLVSKLLVRTS